MDASCRDNPDRVLPVTLDPDAEDRDAALLGLAQALVPSWAGAPIATVTQVHGGLTIRLLRLRCGDLDPPLVRICGANAEVVIGRETENRLFAERSRRGFAPTDHGRFTNGRVEGWLDGFRALEPGELGQPGLRRLIAAELRVLRGLPVPGGARAALGWGDHQGLFGRVRSLERDMMTEACHSGWGEDASP
jgi:hypothetical protein